MLGGRRGSARSHCSRRGRRFPIHEVAESAGEPDVEVEVIQATEATKSDAAPLGDLVPRGRVEVRILRELSDLVGELVAAVSCRGRPHRLPRAARSPRFDGTTSRFDRHAAGANFTRRRDRLERGRCDPPGTRRLRTRSVTRLISISDLRTATARWARSPLSIQETEPSTTGWTLMSLPIP